jgi:hypothetical protein
MAEKKKTQTTGGQQLQQLRGDPLAHLDEARLPTRHSELSGCFWIIPNVVGICYTQEGSGFKVCLRLIVVDVVCQTIDLSNPCVTLEGNVFCAKASVKVCIKGNCLTYEATACYKDLPCLGDWKCVQDSGNIVCF